MTATILPADAFRLAYLAFREEAKGLELAKDSRAAAFKSGGGYSYLNIASCVTPISTLLAKQKLVHYWTSCTNAEQVVCTCHIVHLAGYGIECQVSSPRDTTGGKSAAQSVGSALTYLQRYSLLMVCGLAAGQDNDAAPVVADTEPVISDKTPTFLSDQQLDALRAIAAKMPKADAKEVLSQVLSEFQAASMQVLPRAAFARARSMFLSRTPK